MRLKMFLGVGALLLPVMGAAALASAFSVVEAPRNADGSSRFADPDAAFDAQAEAYQNGRQGVFMFGDRDQVTRRGARRAMREDERRNGRDYTCVQCASELVDGVWLLRHDNGDIMDPAPAP